MLLTKKPSNWKIHCDKKQELCLTVASYDLSMVLMEIFLCKWNINHPSKCHFQKEWWLKIKKYIPALCLGIR